MSASPLSPPCLYLSSWPSSNTPSSTSFLTADGACRSNDELMDGLRSNITRIKQTAGGNGWESRLLASTSEDGQTLFIPPLTQSESHETAEGSQGLSEDRATYEIILKLFYLPHTDDNGRYQHAAEAVNLACRELGVDMADLLIVAFPAIRLSDGDGDEEKHAPMTAGKNEQLPLTELLKTWQSVESIRSSGRTAEVGVAEFDADLLQTFAQRVSLKPSVNQINVRDCCVVPVDLAGIAKEYGIQLSTHNDCTDVLEPGIVRKLLSGTDIAARYGDITPQWIVKYTAVQRERGIIENKGYFLMADAR